MRMKDITMNRAETEVRGPLLDDTLIETLILLPIKSLIRFKGVSTYWCKLITSQDFVIRHLRRDCKQEILLVKRLLLERHCKEQPHPDDPDFYEGYSDDHEPDFGENILSFHDPDFPEQLVSPNLPVSCFDDVDCWYSVDLFGPCNGIVCLVTKSVVALCNPTLRKFKLLDPWPLACPEEYRAEEMGTGFGFDVKNNAYKVIQIWGIKPIVFRDEFWMKIDLYDSSTNSWRAIENPDIPPLLGNPGFDLLFNGPCHWLADLLFASPPRSDSVIVSFDVSNEVFWMLEYPLVGYGLVVYNECLAIVGCDGGEGGLQVRFGMGSLGHFEIWIMKEYGVKESWTKVLVIAGPYFFVNNFTCWRDEWLSVEAVGDQLACCALHANEMKDLEEFKGRYSSFRALIFTESLVRLDQL